VSQPLFLILSTLGLLAALGTVLNRNLVHAALHLVAFFFIVACQFVLLEAEFLAAIQVLVYIGAVAILMMFGIMLTRNIQGDDTTTLSFFWTLPAVAAGLALFVVLCIGIKAKVGPEKLSPWKASQSRPPIVDDNGAPFGPRAVAINNMGKAVGEEMMTRFVVPFEVAGLLLTAALVGAIALASREGDESPLQTRTRLRATGEDGTSSSESYVGNGLEARNGTRREAVVPPAR
jgi:NADH:ubiquinone oxidoreductase subunit 6 (subunit J)